MTYLKRLGLRSGGLAVYAIVAVLCRYAELTALDSYNAVCRPGDRFFSIGPWSIELKGFLLAVLPLMIARSSGAVRTVLIISAAVLAAALVLSITAHGTPYECVTMGGDYEDHTSGIFEFTLFAALSILVSYLVAVADLLLWAFRKAMRP